MANRLADETSLYLVQHKDNPVHWQPWDEAALAQARRENKPILLSVGYSACHWCHVMAHECFENEAIAAQMNDAFVAIKVDREERPDLDAIYQLALALTGQQGGWPLTMFLTPEGQPFWGGTYFPPTPRFGRPGFPQVLDAIADTFATAPDKVRQNTETLSRAIAQNTASVAGERLGASHLDAGARRLDGELDRRHGGLGLAPKFPMTSALDMIWRGGWLAEEDELKAGVAFSLGRICQGGIYDHLSGGFARYSTDERWLAPHFEKMLYDNALLLELMGRLWLDQANPLFGARIEETAEWVLREMVANSGGFASALDADSEGEEGRYYVWTAQEIDGLLGPQSEFFKRVYDVRPDGNWEGRSILNRLAEPGLGEEALETRLAASRAVLLEAREARTRPSWSDAVLADWNGLMIAALARLAPVFERPEWHRCALRAFDYVVGTMGRHDAEGGARLRHAAVGEQVKEAEFLDDYAAMARAALILFDTTQNRRFLDLAQAWTATMDAHYWDWETGGYFYTPDDGESLIVRTKQARDNATPTGNGMMVEVLGRLYHLTGETAYAERAEALLSAFSGDGADNPIAYASLINASGFLDRAVQIVIVAEPDDPAGDNLFGAALRSAEPWSIILRITPDETLPAGHPAAGKETLETGAAAYVCTGPVCSLPTSDPAVLRDALSYRAASAKP
jgi:uncharacterized protein YyaL (SSP411 family)